MIPLAWKNLKHNWVRTAIGMAGVGFAAMLIFMQFGFRRAIQETATQIYDAVDFDLMLRSPAYLHLTEPRSFPEERLLQTRAVPGVASVRPLHIGMTEWQTPAKLSDRGQPPPGAPLQDGDPTGVGRGILLVGVNPYDAPFSESYDSLRVAARALTSPRFVLIDAKSKKEYGPQQGNRFSDSDIGVQTALGLNRVEVVGLFELGSGMVCNGAAMTNIEGYYNACPLERRGEVNLGLIKLAEGVNVEQTVAAINQALNPTGIEDPDFELLTPAQVAGEEREHWMKNTPFGTIFTLGVAVALFVGVAIVYQVLSSDIANMMGEYATLKAIGYGDNYLTAVVMKQSVLLAIVSYMPALVVAQALYWVISASAGIPMELTPFIAGLVLLLTVLMCVASGAVALRKLFNADPASLF